MFIAMAFVGLIEVFGYLRQRYAHKRGGPPEAQAQPSDTKHEEDARHLPLLPGLEAPPKEPARSGLLVLAVPALCDFLGSWLIFAGMPNVDADAEPYLALTLTDPCLPRPLCLPQPLPLLLPKSLALLLPPRRHHVGAGLNRADAHGIQPHLLRPTRLPTPHSASSPTCCN